MRLDVAALLVATGSLVVAYLVHADAVRRDAAVEKRARDREDQHRAADARERAISEVVAQYFQLRHSSGAGVNLHTLVTSGIARLRTDRDMREAISRMAADGGDPLGVSRERTDGEGLDLVEIFDHAIERKISVEHAVEAISQQKKDRFVRHR